MLGLLLLIAVAVSGPDSCILPLLFPFILFCIMYCADQSDYNLLIQLLNINYMFIETLRSYMVLLVIAGILCMCFLSCFQGETHRRVYHNSQYITLASDSSFVSEHHHNQPVARRARPSLPPYVTTRDISAHPLGQIIPYADYPTEPVEASFDDLAHLSVHPHTWPDGFHSYWTARNTPTRYPGQSIAGTPYEFDSPSETHGAASFASATLVRDYSLRSEHRHNQLAAIGTQDSFPSWLTALDINAHPLYYPIIPDLDYPSETDGVRAAVESGEGIDTTNSMNLPSARKEIRNTDKEATKERCDTEAHQTALSCCICLERPKNCVIHTCCHFFSCYECALHLHKSGNAKCPICRKHISNVTQVRLNPAPSDGLSVSTQMETSEQAVSYPCYVCLKAEVNCMISPCLHMCACLDCAREIYTSGNEQCPVCDEKISKITKVYVM